MKKPTIKALFLDFGNVCATFDIYRLPLNLSKIVKVSSEKIKAALFEQSPGCVGYGGYSPLFAAFESGEIEFYGFFSVLMRTLDCAGQIDYVTFAKLWNDIWIKENVALDRLLAHVTVPIYLLSNTNRVIYDNYMSRSRIVRRHIPDRRNHILSCDVGYIKPDPRMSLTAFSRAEVGAKNALFFDDKRENMEPWWEFGGNGGVYNAKTDSIKKLHDQFLAYGILN